MNDIDLKMTYIHQMNDEFSNKEQSEILLTALSAINNVDWLENFYMQLSKSENMNITQLSLTCLGHLARLHKKYQYQ